MNRDFIAQLDAAIGCQQCGASLDASPSDDFCSPRCQAAWSAARVQPLTTYVEPQDQPEHVSNLVELHSPETCVACVEGRHHGHRALPGSLAALLLASGARSRRNPPPQDIEFGYVPVRQYAERVRRNHEELERLNSVMRGQIFVAPVGELLDVERTNWRPLGTTSEGFSFGFDPATREGGGSIVALQRRDGVDYVEAFLSPGYAVLPPELVERMRQVTHEVGHAYAAAWNNVAPVIEDAFRSMSAAVEHACRALRPLAEALRETPPEDPRERALWLRQRRNTGPAARNARAPRAINPRRGR